jgi:hypothetical protein
MGVGVVSNVICESDSDNGNVSDSGTKADISESNTSSGEDNIRTVDDTKIKYYHEHFHKSMTETWVEYQYYPHVNADGFIIDRPLTGSDVIQENKEEPLTRPETPGTDSDATESGYLAESDSSGAVTETRYERSGSNSDLGSDSDSDCDYDSDSDSIANKTSLLILLIFPLKNPSSQLLPFIMSKAFWIRIIVIIIQNMLG